MTVKIVAFAGALSHSVCKTIVELDRRFDAVSWLLVTNAPMRLDRADNLPGLPGEEYRADGLLTRGNLAHVEGSIADIAAELRRFAPDLGLALTAPIADTALIGLPRLGTLAVHKGKLPQYRGAAPVFWAMWNGDDELGCTIELLSESRAGGSVIAETSVRRQKYSTVAGAELLVDEAAIKLVGDAVEQMLAGPARAREVAGGGQGNPIPTGRQVAALRRRLAAALPDQGRFDRRAAKMLYLAARLGLGRLATILWRRPLVTVLTYHRVNDDLRDNVTVGIEQFEQQMAMLRRHCQIVSIEDVVGRALPARPSRPLVCVTFDDGYEDNFTTALPILLKHQIPAAFFVSTGFIGTARRFPHDLAKGLTDLPTMTWGELREMRRHGQVIGSHTVSHIDCAKAEADLLCRELRDSKETLERELGIDRPIFAYPFGRRENITPEALERVKEAGYVACLSAYGGVNRGAIDRFDVRRGGVNWPFSALAFLSRAWGLI